MLQTLCVVDHRGLRHVVGGLIARWIGNPLFRADIDDQRWLRLPDHSRREGDDAVNNTHHIYGDSAIPGFRILPGASVDARDRIVHQKREISEP